MRMRSIFHALVFLVAAAASAQETPPVLLDPAGDAPPAPDALPDDEAPPEFKPAPEQPVVTTTTTPTTTTDSAGHGPVRLVYSPGPWASVCPPLDEVRAGIEGHLGYDPFGEPAQRVVLLLLDGGEAGPDRARVELLDQNMRSLGTRSVSSTEGCAELTATAALQVSIAVDPSHLGRPRPKPLDRIDPAAPSAGSPERPVVTAPVEPLPVLLKPAGEEMTFFGVNAHVAALLTPQIFMLGGSLFAGLRWDWLSGRVEGRMEFPGDDTGTTSVPLLASLVPCAHIPIGATGPGERVEVLGCLTATAGITPTLGTYNGLGVYAGFGGRAGLDWRLDDASSVRAFLQLEGAAVRSRFLSDTGNEYTSPPVNALVGVGVDLPSL
ncbi:MAG: hypothetical protein Q8O67_04800 [Deltaproteobacteria bacterium]|nr:hypothetical protein [Deltaproteobacteria bacterium]